MCSSDLVIVHALDAIGLELGLAQRGQQQRRENRDDGNDHEQFYQRKTGGEFFLRVGVGGMATHGGAIKTYSNPLHPQLNFKRALGMQTWVQQN